MSGPLPSSHQQAAQRTRSNTHFSFRSDRSNELQAAKTTPRPHDHNNTHTHNHNPNPNPNPNRLSDLDRRKSHYDPTTTKANPNAAMEEAQPIAAALEKPTLQSLRSFNHTDVNGNPIAEPDLSNPTRSRWERPLDTIRSFEAAIDIEYRRRAQSMRADQTDIMSGYNSRRSSYYGGAGYDANRYSRASYYGHYPPRDSYDNGYGVGGPVGGPPQRMRYGGNRMQSDPGWHNRNAGNAYPGNGHPQQQQQQQQQPPQPHDFAHANGSNGNYSDGVYSNEPSSDNSSFERGVPVRPHQQMPHDVGDPYNHFAGAGKGPQMDAYAQGPPDGYMPPQQQNGMQNVAPPPPPPPKQTGPIKLNSSGPSPGADSMRPNMLAKTHGEEKRRSWLRRRFSKE